MRVNIYPNPVQDRLVITNTNGIENVTIYNALGQPIKQLVVNNEQLSIEVKDLPKGIYTVRLRQANGATITKQFVK